MTLHNRTVLTKENI